MLLLPAQWDFKLKQSSDAAEQNWIDQLDWEIIDIGIRLQ